MTESTAGIVAALVILMGAAEAHARPDLQNPNFERGLSGWTKTGTAFDTQPTYEENVLGARVNAVRVGGTYWTDIPYPIGIRDHYWIGTYENRPNSTVPLGTTQGDEPIGTLTSAPFMLPDDAAFLSFLIGGGEDARNLMLELLVVSGHGNVAIPGIAVMTGLGSEILRRDVWALGRLDRSAEYVIVITDRSSHGHLSVDDLRFELSHPADTAINGHPRLLRTTINGRPAWTDYDAPLWGSADLHTHLMSHLSMGGKLMHGAPDVGSLAPAGTIKQGFACNKTELRTTSLDDTLPDCSATHGGWGLTNECGDSIRSTAINRAYDTDNVHLLPPPVTATCAPGLSLEVGLCYTPCAAGYVGFGPSCVQQCPAGFDDALIGCIKPDSYGRGVGYFGHGDDLAACRQDNPQGCEQCGLPYFPVCKPGLHGLLCNECVRDCPAGMTDLGLACTKNLYDRGLGSLPVSNLFGDHEHAGWPTMAYWPHASSKAHQQMYVDWIQRAHDGGLNVLVALAVNNPLLGEVVNGNAPKDDQASADLQLDEIRAFIGRHAAFMREVGSAVELRQAIKDGKLAVIVGIEVDNIGNFNVGNPLLLADAKAVKAEINRLYTAKGVRYIFPLHFSDNVLGGVAVKGALFNLSNRFARTRPLAIGQPFPPGFLYQVETASDPLIDYRLEIFDGAGWANSLTLGTAQALLLAVGAVPFLPAFDPLTCPFPTLNCVPQFKLMASMLSPDLEWDAYQFVPGGHVNARGLTPIGEIAIQEMMRLGMIIDVDHMSEKSANRTLELAEMWDYPVNSGHTGFRAQPRGVPVNENDRSPTQLTRLGALGGMMGVGWAGGDAQSFLDSYRFGVQHGGVESCTIDLRTRIKTCVPVTPPAFSLGSDINGFEETPHVRPGAAVVYCPDAASCAANPGALREYAFGVTASGLPRLWDYNAEGVAHIGLYPDIYQDLKNLAMTGAERTQFFGATDALARMWDKIERQKAIVP